MPARRMPIRDVAIGLLVHDRRILFVQRRADLPLGGLWELIGGKIEPGETPEAALRREVREESQLAISACAPLGVFDHAYAHVRVRLHAFASDVAWPEPVLNGPADHRWVRLPELDALPILAGTEPLLHRMRVRGLW